MNNLDIMKIANITGFSNTSVIKALSGSDTILEIYKAKILRACAELGYPTDGNTAKLPINRPRHIGIFVTSLEVGSQTDYLNEVFTQAKRLLPKEYTISIDSTLDYLDDVETIEKKNYDGIILLSQSQKEDVFIREVKQRKIPVIVLNRKISIEGTPNYSEDDRFGAMLTTEFALNQGHHNFGILKGPGAYASSGQHYLGLVNNFQSYGLDSNVPIINGGSSPTEGYEGMTRLLAEDPTVTCVFCDSDSIALGAMRACEDKQISVPQQISIFGYGNDKFSKYTTPAITTVTRPTRKMVLASLEALERLISGDFSVANDSQEFKPELIVRESVAKPQ